MVTEYKNKQTKSSYNCNLFNHIEIKQVPSPF